MNSAVLGTHTQGELAVRVGWLTYHDGQDGQQADVELATESPLSSRVDDVCRVLKRDIFLALDIGLVSG